MIEAPPGFPPFDAAGRPTGGGDGRQLSTGTFVGWFMPGIWLDGHGQYHIDVPAWHRWLGWPMTAASIRETGLRMKAMLEAQAMAHPSGLDLTIITRAHPFE